MRVRYGNLLFQPGAVGVSRSITVARETDGGIPVLFQWKYDCELFLTSTQPTLTLIQADLANQERIARVGLSQPNQPFIVFLDNGQLSDMVLYPNQCRSGPTVKLFENPTPGMAEYASKRTIRFSVVALVAANGMDKIYLSFQESIRSSGTGGPIKKDFVTIDGVNVRQTLYPKSLCRAVQAGSLVSFDREVTPADAPKPLWTKDEELDQRDVTVGSPIRMPNGYIQYPLSWTYTFVRPAEPFVGRPNRQV